jgi:hypothetical protein
VIKHQRGKAVVSPLICIYEVHGSHTGKETNYHGEDCSEVITVKCPKNFLK